MTTGNAPLKTKCAHCDSTLPAHTADCPDLHHTPAPIGPTGWICPKCHAGNSPWTTRCNCTPIGWGPITC